MEQTGLTVYNIIFKGYVGKWIYSQCVFCTVY